MNLQETEQTLMVISRHQQWFKADEMTSLSWHESLEPSIDRDWAIKHVTKHFAKHDTSITASSLNKAWSDYLSYKAIGNIDREAEEARCVFPECRCTHSGGCYKGWIDNSEGSTTAPCPSCRPSLYKTLHEVNPLGQRTDADSTVIQMRFKSATNDYY